MGGSLESSKEEEVLVRRWALCLLSVMMLGFPVTTFEYQEVTCEVLARSKDSNMLAVIALLQISLLKFPQMCCSWRQPEINTIVPKEEKKEEAKNLITAFLLGNF